MSELTGRYGVLRLLSNKSGKPVTRFPIDVDVLTFGRDVSCDIRMYFTFVSPLHAKLILEDHKAFLSVMGAQGVVLDGNVVTPSESSGEPCIVPIGNKSRFTIHNKTFEYECPPKERRAQHITTPPPKSRKSLRMSMINAARIMSPNTRITPSSPSLEVLQSPIKPFADIKSSEERDLEVTLAEGEDVTVSKQGNDLVIVESINEDVQNGYDENENESGRDENSNPVQSEVTENKALNSSDYSVPVQPPPRPRTPKNRVSLHKAVLVRNSRLAMMERDDEEEVIEVVSPERAQHEISDEGMDDDDDDDEDDEPGPEGDDGEGEYLAPVKGGADSDEEESEQVVDPESRSPRRSLGLRASLEALGKAFIAPFSGRWGSGAGDQGAVEGDSDSSHEESEDDTEDDSDPGNMEEEHPELPSRDPFVSRSEVLSQKTEDHQYTPPSPELIKSPPRVDFTRTAAGRAPSFLTPQPVSRSLTTVSIKAPDTVAGPVRTKNITQPRRSRFSSFGLPAYVLNTNGEDEGDEDESQENTVEGPITTNEAETQDERPTKGKQNVPSSASTLASLQKRVQHFQIDNARRASRLSFSSGGAMSPLPVRLKQQQETAEPIQSQRAKEEDVTSSLQREVFGAPERAAPDAGPTSGSTFTFKCSSPLVKIQGKHGRVPPPPTTPSFTGFRSLFATSPKHQPGLSTPSVSGVKNLFHIDQRNAAPSTPDMSGLESIFTSVEGEGEISSEEGEAEEEKAVMPESIQADSDVIKGKSEGLVDDPLQPPKRNTRARATRSTVAGVAATGTPAASVLAKTRSSVRASGSGSSRIPTSSRADASHVKRSTRKAAAALQEPKQEDHAEESTPSTAVTRSRRLKTPQAAIPGVVGEVPIPKLRSTRNNSKAAAAAITYEQHVSEAASSTRRTRASPAELPAKVSGLKRARGAEDVSAEAEDTISAASINNAVVPNGARVRRGRKAPIVKEESPELEDGSTSTSRKRARTTPAAENEESAAELASMSKLPVPSRKASGRGGKSAVKKRSPTAMAMEETVGDADKENAPSSVASSDNEDERAPAKPSTRTSRKIPARKASAKTTGSTPVAEVKEEEPPVRALRARSTRK